MDLASEAKFLQEIAVSLLSIVSKNNSETVISEKKAFSDFSTKVDTDTENFIVAEIKKLFSGDQILAEEGYDKDVNLSQRTWVIDPICGTSNLAKGIKFYCTNIALVERNKVIAACVVDYSQDRYYWSVGEGLYLNNKLLKPVSRPGIKIDIDLGAVTVKRAELSIFKRHQMLTERIFNQTEYEMISLNTSLGFAYIATGSINGVVNTFCKPWDVCAAVFLIQQAGGTVSGLDGEQWEPKTVGLIAADTANLHSELVDFFKEK